MSNTYKGGMDKKANAAEWAGGGKVSNVDTAGASKVSWRGGARDTNDPSKTASSGGKPSGSTNLVGRKGEPGRHDYPCPPPVLGFSPTAGHAHLGHFKSEQILKAGHNDSRLQRRVANSGSDRRGGSRRPKMSDPFRPAVGTPVVEPGGGFKTPEPMSGKVPRGARAARRAIKSGNAAVAAAKPVIAARVGNRARLKAARQSGEKGAVVRARELNRASVRTARSSTESRRSERKARKGGSVRVGRPTTVTSPKRAY